MCETSGQSLPEVVQVSFSFGGTHLLYTSDIYGAYANILCTGIGRTLASAYAVNGANVIITGRRKDLLEETAKELNEAISGGAGKVYPFVIFIISAEKGNWANVSICG